IRNLSVKILSGELDNVIKLSGFKVEILAHVDLSRRSYLNAVKKPESEVGRSLTLDMHNNGFAESYAGRKLEAYKCSAVDGKSVIFPGKSRIIDSQLAVYSLSASEAILIYRNGGELGFVIRYAVLGGSVGKPLY